MWAMTSMGLPIGKVEVDPVSGKISISPAPDADTTIKNPWDEALDNAQDKKRTAKIL